MESKMKAYTTWGTAYFPTKLDARKYYALQGEDIDSIDDKIDEGHVYIGEPPCKSGERAILITNNYGDKRWFKTTIGPVQ